MTSHPVAPTRFCLPDAGSLPGDRGSLLDLAVNLLRDAAVSADEVGRERWDFAVEIWGLLAAGLTLSDLRRLVCEGIIEHQCETTQSGDARRNFIAPHSLRLTERSCFVLAEDADADFPGQSRSSRTGLGGPLGCPAHRVRLAPATLGRPQWNQDRRELTLGGQVVKTFHRAAPNQELILQAFQEEGWPERIADPLSLVPGLAPKRRLQETVRSLNTNHREHLLVFHGDGSGEGIRWCRADELPLQGVPNCEPQPTLRLRRAA
jgi:hypothetical protein